MEIKTVILIIFLLFSTGGILLSQELPGKTDSVENLSIQGLEVIKTFEATLAQADMLPVRPTLPEVVPIDRRYEYRISMVSYPIVYADPIIRPIAMKKEPPEKVYKSYIKAGYGNLKNPLLNASFYRRLSDLSDWQLNIDYDGLDNGDVNPQQEYNTLSILSDQNFNVLESERLETSFAFQREERGFYYNGEDDYSFPDVFNPSRIIERLKFESRFFNAEEKDLELDYLGDLSVHHTKLEDLDLGEWNSQLGLYFTKKGYENFSFSFNTLLDYNILGGEGSFVGKYVPQFLLTRTKLRLKIGLSMIQANQELTPFPEISLAYQLDPLKIQLFLGSDQNYYRNNLQNLVSFNPYVTGIDSLPTNISWDIYGGVKGDIDGLQYQVKAGYKNFDNLATFNVDFNDPLRRVKVEVADAQSVYISGSLEYPVHDYVSIGAFTTQNFYSNISIAELWHIPTLEFSAFAQFNFFKDKVSVKPSLYLRDRVNALNEDGLNQELDDLIDFNLALEVRPVERIRLWLDGYNLFDKSYRRWYGYENVGIHFQGGMKVIF